MWYFSLKAQIKLTSIVEKSNFQQSIEELNKVNYGFTLFNYHKTEKNRLILEYENIQNQKNGYLYLQHSSNQFSSKSSFTNFSDYDSILIFLYIRN